ncbi:hypothetical protein HanPI659440_Chr04g0165701 [Helianthus annuus]|nr:hypothetical protein HanPI659440_Chr04g0165701 [Helianthus annuus]
MKVNHISTHLGFWLMRNFDEQLDELNVGNNKIKITSDVVYEVFGIPKGTKPIVTIVDKQKVKKDEKIEKNNDPDGGDSIMHQFISQWSDTKTITHGVVATTMNKQNEGGSLFKINFLVYWNTIFVEITKATTVNDKCLLGVDTVEDIPHLDWCSYLLESLLRIRKGRKNPNIQYVGRVAFLTVCFSILFNYI